MKTHCEVHHLGVMDYQQAWQLQDHMATEIARGERPPTLLLLQHPHCYTFGRRGKPENLLWDEDLLRQKGIQVYWADRGGDVTYHGPGQLVGYPLIPLGTLDVKNASLSADVAQPKHIPRVDYTGYLRKLEAVIILALLRLGVPGGQINGLTGVWVQPDIPSRCTRCDPKKRQQPAKIAALGVKVDARGISRHGFAINIDPEMRFWDGIVACGLKDHPVASLADFLETPPDLNQVASLVSNAFGEIFDYEMVQPA
jgi:lipoate-protein ligase B